MRVVSYHRIPLCVSSSVLSVTLWFVPLMFRKYFNIFRIALIERLTYRSDFLLTSALRLLPMVTTILLWGAVYAGSGRDELAGFRMAEMVAYLLLVHISRMFSSMPGLAGGIAQD